MALTGVVRRRILGISPAETRFSRRGFRVASRTTRERLEEVGKSFVDGYHAALRDDRPNRLEKQLSRVAPELRGFAYEGAAMGLSLCDVLSPWRVGRVANFLRGPGEPHVYMVHIGVGWAFARLRRMPGIRARSRRVGAALDPLYAPLATDGVGFHDGYFDWPRTVSRHERAPGIAGYGVRAFDQGLGRSLWFVGGGDPLWIAGTILGYHAARRADLWSGVGLAATYAGGVPDSAVRRVAQLAAEEHRPHLAQGSAFAVKARVRAGNLAPHSESACRILTGTTASTAAGWTDEALADLAPDGPPDARYESWRNGIRARYRLEAA